MQSFCRTCFDSPALVWEYLTQGEDKKEGGCRRMEPEDGARGWSHPLVALQDGCRYRWAVMPQLFLEHIQIPPILHCLGAFFTASLCTALKMRVCLKIIYHLIITLMQAAQGTSASAKLSLLLLMWRIAGEAGRKPNHWKCLGGGCEEEEEDERWMRHQGPTHSPWSQLLCGY